MTDQTRQQPVDPAHATVVVSALVESAGLTVRDEYTRSDVCEILTRRGYECTPGTILEFVRKGYISDPGATLSPVDVYCLAGALEARRRWGRTPSKHDFKKSAARLRIEELQNEGVENPVKDIDGHTVEDLLIQLTTNENRMVRETLYETLRLKLAGYEE